MLVGDGYVGGGDTRMTTAVCGPPDDIQPPPYEQLLNTHNGRGFYVSSWLIRADTWLLAREIANEQIRWSPIQDIYIDPARMPDGRWYCTIAYDSGV